MYEIPLGDWQLNIVQKKKIEKKDMNIGHRGGYALKNLMESLKI